MGYTHPPRNNLFAYKPPGPSGWCCRCINTDPGRRYSNQSRQLSRSFTLMWSLEALRRSNLSLNISKAYHIYHHSLFHYSDNFSRHSQLADMMMVPFHLNHFWHFCYKSTENWVLLLCWCTLKLICSHRMYKPITISSILPNNSTFWDVYQLSSSLEEPLTRSRTKKDVGNNIHIQKLSHISVHSLLA